MLVAVAAAVLIAVLATHPTIEPVTAPSRASFDPVSIARGEQLAAIGSCAACHTAQDGAPFAGGVAVPTPFGTVYGSNVTPDAKTGIGQWSEAAFRRAMRDGVARDGHQLYPAFPYDHFTRLTDADLHALYAFLMTRTPVRAATPPNRLRFPFGFRPLLAGWNLLYLDKTPVRVDPQRSAEWNRGAYLVQALAHCSSCHSPRNALGAELGRDYLAGGSAEGWHAPALNTASPSPLPWSVEQLSAYLRTGLARDHAIAGGPMQGVVDGLATVDAADVQAIAVYIGSVIGGPSPERKALAAANRRRAELGTLALPQQSRGGETAQLKLGASVFAQACARCHDGGRRVSSDSALQLPLALAVHNPDPSNLIRIVRDGIVPPDTQPGRWMPAFGAALTDEQLTALVVFLRRYAAAAPPWPDVAAQVRKVPP